MNSLKCVLLIYEKVKLKICLLKNLKLSSIHSLASWDVFLAWVHLYALWNSLETDKNGPTPFSALGKFGNRV